MELYEPPQTIPTHDDSPEHATADTGAAFTKAAKPFDSLKGKLSEANDTLSSAKSDLSLEEINSLQAQIDALRTTLQEQKKQTLQERMFARIGALQDDEVPDFGAQFMAAVQTSGCKIILSTQINSHAVYTSYSYAKHNFGFANEMKVNPALMDNEDKFTGAGAHELVHSFQKHVSPALQRSPFNPYSRAIIHPADWIMLESLCERDAYTKQALINSLLAKTNPDVRANTKKFVVSVDDFETIRAGSPSLADAVLTTALRSLSKPTDPDFPKGRTFADNYQDVALENYRRGMVQRKKEKETDLVFLRVEFGDLWQIGNYGVGPNSFGENVPEPLIATRHKLCSSAQEKLDSICAEYNIPPLENCPTLREYEESLAFTQAQTQTAQDPKPAPSFIS